MGRSASKLDCALPLWLNAVSIVPGAFIRNRHEAHDARKQTALKEGLRVESGLWVQLVHQVQVHQGCGCS